MSGIPTPFGGQNREKLSKQEYLGGILGVIIVFGTIVLYAFEIKYFHNTFEVSGLVYKALGLGFLVGATVSYFFSKRYNDLLDKFKTYVFFIMVIMLVFPLLASLSNRLLSFSQKEIVKVELLDQRVFSQSRFGMIKGQVSKDGYYIFIQKENKIKRLKMKNLFFPTAKKGDLIPLTFKKGFWGYEYFIEE